MSIKIHHGPPGSYKTSGAVMDDLIPAIKEGRVIVTNIRGFTRERVLDVYPDTPESFDVISIDTRSAEGRMRLAIWFHWVPIGAFLIIDEAQMVWPKSWRDADIAKLAFPASEEHPNYVDAAAAAGRPSDFVIAFDMHRHYNWDMVLTTPDIRKIREDIRLAGEFAYKHKNLALLGNMPGFKGRYIEGTHLIGDNGSSVGQFTTIVRRKVHPDVWKLYDSTATGNYTDTKAGRSLLKDPKILGLICVVLACGAYAAYGAQDSKLLNGATTEGPAPALAGGTVDTAQDRPATAPGAADGLHHGSAGQAGPVEPAALASPRATADLDPILSQPVVVAGMVEMRGIKRAYFSLGYTTTVTHIDSQQLADLGYQVTVYADCAVLVRNPAYGSSKLITCPVISGEGKGRPVDSQALTPPSPYRPPVVAPSPAQGITGPASADVVASMPERLDPNTSVNAQPMVTK